MVRVRVSLGVKVRVSVEVRVRDLFKRRTECVTDIRSSSLPSPCLSVASPCLSLAAFLL